MVRGNLDSTGRCYGAGTSGYGARRHFERLQHGAMWLGKSVEGSAAASEVSRALAR